MSAANTWPDGSELLDLSAALAEALAAARGLVAEHVKAGIDPDGQRFEISDAAGRTLGAAPFRDALKPDSAGDATMGWSEDRPAQAERQFREAETRVARQAAALEKLDRPGHERAAEKAREALAIMRMGVALARLCLIVELAWSEDGPGRRARPDA